MPLGSPVGNKLGRTKVVLVTISIWSAMFLGNVVNASAEISKSPDNYQFQDGDKPYGFHTVFATSAIKLYQILISPSRGTNCPMTPHCSKFGMMAFSRYNPLKAWTVTADRLHRCGHELQYYPLAAVDGQLRFVDSSIMVSTKVLTPDVDDAVYFADAPDGLSTDSNTEVDDGVTSRGMAVENEDLLWEFANNLMIERDYNRAITEFRRLLYYYPTTRHDITANVSLFRCYYRIGEFLDAIHLGEDLIVGKNGVFYEKEIGFLIGASYFNLNNYSRTVLFLSELDSHNDREVQDKSDLLVGLAYASKHDWGNAERQFLKIDQESQYYPNAQGCVEMCQQGLNLKFKSPTKAGLLAIVPGMGYLYAGYKQTAFSALIVNGLFMWGTYEAYDRGNTGTGVMLSLLSFGWYSGNIFGSVASAKRRNIYVEESLVPQFNIGVYF